MFGLPLSGSITVDSDVAPTLNPEPGFGVYSGFEFLSAFSVDFAGFRFTLDPDRTGAFARGIVFNIPEPDPFGVLGFQASLGTGLLTGPGSGLAIELRLTSQDTNIINSERLPANLAALRQFEVSVNFVDPVSNSSVGYFSTLDSFTRLAVVPGPSTALLLGFGVLLLAFRCRQRVTE